MRNLDLWNEVQETAPGFTKQADLQGRLVTSINGTYMVKRATEQFGPVGIGWGYEVADERFDQGAPFFDSAGKQLGVEVMHTIKLTLWYMLDGKRGEVTHYGHTPYIMGTKWGLKTDHDAPKKSMTDAIKKCLSMLGFSADIFLGMYDDAEYVESVKVKEQIDKADNADDERLRQRTEFGEWAERELAIYPRVPNKAALRMMHQGHVKKVQRQCQVLGLSVDKAVQRFNDALKARMDELDPDIELVCPGCGCTGRGKSGSDCPECQTKRNPA